MTRVDYTDPRRADAMRQCNEGRGVFLPPSDPLLNGDDARALAKTLVVGFVMAAISAAAIALLM